MVSHFIDNFERVIAYLPLQAMNGQYLCNRQITVSYAYKKDTKGERHGTPAGQSSSLLCLFLLWSVNIIHLDYYNIYSPIKFEVSLLHF